MNTTHVLIPLDGSAWSREVLREAPRLFDPARTRVTLLRVADTPQGVVAVPRVLPVDRLMLQTYESSYDAEIAAHPIYATQAGESRRAQLEADLLPDARRLEQAGFQVRLLVRFGDPATEIIDAAEDEGVDLILMATHGRTGLQRLVLGSVAAEVLRRGQVPVLMVRPVARAVERQESPDFAGVVTRE